MAWVVWAKATLHLKYAETKMEHFQTVLWIHSETAESLKQSFTDISMRLQLNGADRGQHEKNRIEVLNWLHETCTNCYPLTSVLINLRYEANLYI